MVFTGSGDRRRRSCGSRSFANSGEAPPSDFFEREQYKAVRRHLPDDLKEAVTIAHPHLFPHVEGRRGGQPRQDLRKPWKIACKNAGCIGMVRHDFRRTAVRTMVNLGVPEKVAMAVTGHKTRNGFDRYLIVSPSDLQDLARRFAEQSG